jgi:mannose-6-phosphate isomerase-like protein (cupin superfamily)
MIAMVSIFKASEVQAIHRKGYSASYVADILFRQKIDTSGFILVEVAGGTKSSPHKHEELEEVFVCLADITLIIDSVAYDLQTGDVVLVSPGESHSFENRTDSSVTLLAIKFPNLKNDKAS